MPPLPIIGGPASQGAKPPGSSQLMTLALSRDLQVKYLVTSFRIGGVQRSSEACQGAFLIPGQQPLSACRYLEAVPPSPAGFPACLPALSGIADRWTTPPAPHRSPIGEETSLHLDFKQVISVGCGCLDHQARPAVSLARGDVEMSAIAVPSHFPRSWIHCSLQGPIFCLSFHIC